MTAICLDTSAYSQMRRGHERATELIRRARIVHVPSIVLGELRAGFRLGSRRRENESRLDAFLQESVVRVLDVDGDAASFYADLVVALRKGGTPLPTNDIWIGALAWREGSRVVTSDRHFEKMRGVAVELLDS